MKFIKSWLKAQEERATLKKTSDIEDEIERLTLAIQKIPDDLIKAQELASREYQVRVTEINYNAERRKIDMNFQIEQLHLELFKVRGGK